MKKTQMDLVYFYRSMPTITKTMLPGIFLMSLPMTVFFPPIAVTLAGRWRKTGEEAARAHLRPAAFLNWLWKATLLAVIVYPLLFALFGYFVAWQNPALRAYYGATQTGGFFNTGFFGGDLSLYPFEVLRGLLWVCVVTTVVLTGRGKWWERALLAAFLLALVMNDVHLLPNPRLARPVRSKPEARRPKGDKRQRRAL